MSRSIGAGASRLGYLTVQRGAHAAGSAVLVNLDLIEGAALRCHQVCAALHCREVVGRQPLGTGGSADSTADGTAAAPDVHSNVTVADVAHQFTTFALQTEISLQLPSTLPCSCRTDLYRVAWSLHLEFCVEVLSPEQQGTAQVEHLKAAQVAAAATQVLEWSMPLEVCPTAASFGAQEGQKPPMLSLCSDEHPLHQWRAVRIT